jgi:hypothetical protein
MTKMNQSTELSRVSVHIHPFLGVPPSSTTREAEDFQKQVAEEIAKMRGNERAQDMLQDFDDGDLEHETISEPDDSQPLTVEPPLTLSKIIPKLTAIERLWMVRIVRAHGKEVVLARWPAYEIHINYVRCLR